MKYCSNLPVAGHCQSVSARIIDACFTYLLTNLECRRYHAGA